MIRFCMYCITSRCICYIKLFIILNVIPGLLFVIVMFNSTTPNQNEKTNKIQLLLHLLHLLHLVAPKGAFFFCLVGSVEWVEFCYVAYHVPEVVTWVDFSPVEVIKIGWKLAFGGSDHHPQLYLHLTADRDSVCVGSCIRINKVI